MPACLAQIDLRLLPAAAHCVDLGAEEQDGPREHARRLRPRRRAGQPLFPSAGAKERFRLIATHERSHGPPEPSLLGERKSAVGGLRRILIPAKHELHVGEVHERPRGGPQKSAALRLLRGFAHQGESSFGVAAAVDHRDGQHELRLEPLLRRADGLRRLECTSRQFPGALDLVDARRGPGRTS